MREILFRGKRTENGEWVYGEYFGLCAVANDDGEVALKYLIHQSNDEPLYSVDAETVGQYTGLTDKNGKKIFEGDIVRYRPEYWCEPKLSVVEYCADKWNYPAFDLKDHDYEANGLQCAHEEGGLEVIGTIYDNPELLGGVKE